jgi:hypothetical protein
VVDQTTLLIPEVSRAHLSTPGFSDEDAMQARYVRESGVTDHVLVLNDSPTAAP